MLARMTIVGMYKEHPTLFDGMTLPNGLDKENVVNAVLDKGAVFGCIYPDADFLEMYITTWSKRHLGLFQRWKDLIDINYMPINDYSYTEHTAESEHNESDETGKLTGDTSKNTISNAKYEGSEERHENSSGTASNTKTYSETKTNTENGSKENSGNESETVATDTKINTSNSNTITETENIDTEVENKVSAFDSSSYSPESMSTTDTDRTGTKSGSETGSETRDEDVTRSKKFEDSETTSKNSSETTSGNESNNGSTSGQRITNVNDTNTKEYSESVSENEIEQTSKNKETNSNTIGDKTITGKTGRYSYQELIKQSLELATFELEEKIADMLVDDICVKVY